MTTTVEGATAASAWASITRAAARRSAHAHVLAALAEVGDPTETAALVAAYRRHREAGTCSWLDDVPLSAGHIADLAIIAAGGDDGVPPSRVDGAKRAYLVRHGLAVDVDRYHVRATMAGQAVIRWARGRRVELTTAEAHPLGLIETAMLTTAERGLNRWPGTANQLRIAQLWRLVEWVRVDDDGRRSEHWSSGLPRSVYRLTAEGTAAMERRRESSKASGTVHDDGRTDRPTRRSAAVLAAVAAAQPSGDVDYRALDIRNVEQCEAVGWTERGGPIGDTGRCAYRLTERGAAALAAWQFREQQRAAAADTPYRTAYPYQLTPGMSVRLVNRARRPAGLGWVTVAEIRHPHDDDGRLLANNYEVVVTADGRPAPFVYGGGAHYRTVKFQVQPL
jgi:hypothetical protein